MPGAQRVNTHQSGERGIGPRDDHGRPHGVPEAGGDIGGRHLHHSVPVTVRHAGAHRRVDEHHSAGAHMRKGGGGMLVVHDDGRPRNGDGGGACTACSATTSVASVLPPRIMPP